MRLMNSHWVNRSVKRSRHTPSLFFRYISYIIVLYNFILTLPIVKHGRVKPQQSSMPVERRPFDSLIAQLVRRL